MIPASQPRPALSVWQLSEHAVGFGPPPLASASAVTAWRAIASDFLRFAFAGRALCLIGDGARVHDWSYADGLPTRVIDVASAAYLVAFAEPAARLRWDDLIASCDHAWDAVWLAPLRVDELAIARALVEGVRFDRLGAPPIAPAGRELVVSVGDGRGFWWLHPGRGIRQIAETLAELAAAAGWVVDPARSPGR